MYLKNKTHHQIQTYDTIFQLEYTTTHFYFSPKRSLNCHYLAFTWPNFLNYMQLQSASLTMSTTPMVILPICKQITKTFDIPTRRNAIEFHGNFLYPAMQKIKCGIKIPTWAGICYFLETKLWGAHRRRTWSKQSP